MAYKNLQEFIKKLEQENELVRITTPVNPEFEITEITDRVVKNGGSALLFENTGKDFPLLINAYGSGKRMCLALGVEKLDDIGNDIETLFKKIAPPPASFLEKLRLIPTLKEFASWVPKKQKAKGICQEQIMPSPDITQLPVLKCWPNDGGPFITLPSVHTIDPETGQRNVGMYRMQVFNNNTTGMHWHRHKGSAAHFEKYKKLKQRMPVTVTLGGDPVYAYVASAPLPENFDEYILAGFLRKKKVELVKCLTNDLYVPSDVDFVIEGYVDPQEAPVMEGPFGDHTGFYSLADLYPKFHITCITHRRNAIYTATIVGIPPQEDTWLGKATERIFLTPIRLTTLPEIEDMVLPAEGVFHNLAIVKIKKSYPGHALKVMNSLWGAGQMMFNKIMAVVDGNVDINNHSAVLKQIAQHCNPATDLHFSGGPLDVLDHASNKTGLGTKLGIDATIKLPEEQSNNIQPPPQNKDYFSPLKQYPDIAQFNASFPLTGIPLMVIAIKKNRKNHVRELHNRLAADGLLTGIKFVIYLDAMADVTEMAEIAWIFSNNIDPVRDCFFPEPDSENLSCLGIEGTRKTKAFDGFERDWPNVIVMDENTIGTMNQKWPELGLGKLIESPSLKYRRLIFGSGAVAE